jgi:hypothetical protein
MRFFLIRLCQAISALAMKWECQLLGNPTFYWPPTGVDYFKMGKDERAADDDPTFEQSWVCQAHKPGARIKCVSVWEWPEAQ